MTPPASSSPAAMAACSQRRDRRQRAGPSTQRAQRAAAPARRAPAPGARAAHRGRRPIGAPGGVLRVLAQPGLDLLALLWLAVQLAIDPGAEQFVVDRRAFHVHTTRRSVARARLSALAVEQGAQRRPRAAHARHHRAHRDVQHLGHLGITELLHAHQQQRLALLGRQPRQRCEQVQAQPDVHAGVAAQAVLRRLQHRWVEHLHPCLLAPHVLVRVVRDGQQPHHHVALLVELMPVRQRAFQRALHQVVALRVLEHQRSRIAPQPWHGAEQLLTKCAGGWVHLIGLTRAGGRLFPAGHSRRSTSPSSRTSASRV